MDDNCDISGQSLKPTPLDAGFLDRAHRFLRLWRRTGYKMWELGLLLPRRSLFGGAISTQGIVALYWFRRLQDATELPLDAQLAFFLPMDKAAHRDPDGSATTSLYARTFLNPLVPPDPDLQQLLLAAPRLDRDALSDHQTALQAALAITAGRPGFCSSSSGSVRAASQFLGP